MQPLPVEGLLNYSPNILERNLRIKNCQKNKKLAEEIKRLSRILFFNNKSLMRFFAFDIKPKCPLKRISLPLKIYIEIEKELSSPREEMREDMSSIKAN